MSAILDSAQEANTRPICRNTVACDSLARQMFALEISLITRANSPPLHERMSLIMVRVINEYCICFIYELYIS